MSHGWRIVVFLLGTIFTCQFCCLTDLPRLNLGETATADYSNITTPEIFPTQDTVITATSITPTITVVTPVDLPMIQETVEYDMVQTVILRNSGPEEVRIEFKLAMIQDLSPYQRVISMSVSQNYQTIYDEYGNKYADFEFSNIDVGEEQT